MQKIQSTWKLADGRAARLERYSVASNFLLEGSFDMHNHCPSVMCVWTLSQVHFWFNMLPFVMSAVELKLDWHLRWSTYIVTSVCLAWIFCSFYRSNNLEAAEQLKNAHVSRNISRSKSCKVTVTLFITIIRWSTKTHSPHYRNRPLRVAELFIGPLRLPEDISYAGGRLIRWIKRS